MTPTATSSHRTRLTKTVVDNAQPQKKRFYLWDSEIRGLGLLVLPSGGKSFILAYRTALGGVQRRLTIGQFGDITPTEARAKAAELREVIRNGGDPLGQKKAARDALTVAQMLDLYLDSESFKAKAPGTQYNDLGRIRRHLKPLIGRIPAAALTAREIEKAMQAIRNGATAVREKSGRPRGFAKVSGGPTAAINCAVLLRGVFNWAIKQRLLKENPTAGVKIGTPGIRDTILDADAYRRLFETLARLEDEGRIRPAVAGSLAVIALTGARKTEIAGLRWRHINIKTGQIILPPTAHKTGRKTGRNRTIGLPAMAQTIIAKQPPGYPDDLVFRPHHGDRPLNLTKPWTIVRSEAQLPPDAVIHSLRHSVASHSAMAGMSTVEMMTSLGHASVQHLTRYVHYAENSRQALAEKAASVAIAAMQAAAGTPKAEIVALPSPRRGK